MKRNYLLVTILALLTVLALSACGPALLSAQVAPATAVLGAPVAGGSTRLVAAGGSLGELQTALEDIYAKVNPSVVSIQVVDKVDMTGQNMPDFPGMPFFFGPQGRSLPQQQAPNPYRQGAGSGFVWDKEGHIITNNHVVDGADKIQVTFADGSMVKADVVGTDPDSDLAVLKVDVPADRLQPVQLADSAQVKVGQLAIAIGNPFTLENTMTVGFVSAMGRQLPVNTDNTDGSLSTGPTYTIPDIIQTDAPINPGNSGGVLVNDQGQVIGVTAAIESPVRASAGIGFAIPAAIVQQVVPALIQTGSYTHPWVGLSGTTLNPDLAEAMNLTADQRGALVVDVTPNGPADKAGLHGSDRQVQIDGIDMLVGGDVITAIDGQPVKKFDDVITYLARSTKVDQTIKLTVLRDGKEETVNVTLAARPSANPQRDQAQPQQVGDTWLGIRGLSITPDLAKALDLPANQRGILVEQVEMDSPADQASLRGSFKSMIISGQRVATGGDIITAIDGQPVSTTEELQGFLQDAKPGQKITLTVLRDGKQVEVPVTLSERPAGGS